MVGRQIGWIPMSYGVFEDSIAIKESFLLAAGVELPEKDENRSRYWSALCEIEQETIRKAILQMIERQLAK